MSEISIIVPVYNSEKYIKACFDSLIGQTFKDIEIIAVNNGSTDAGDDIINSFLTLDTRVKKYSFSEVENGPGHSRNKGLDVAQSPYIMFVDPDDVVAPDMCQTAYDEIKRHRVDILQFGYERLEEGEEPSFKKPERSKSRLYSDPLAAFLSRRFKVFVWNKIYRREVLEKVRFDHVFYEDMAFSLEAMARAKTAASIQTPLYAYIKHPGSITGMLSIRHINDRFLVFERLKNLRSGFKLSFLKRRKYDRFMYKIIFLGLEDIFRRGGEEAAEFMKIYREKLQETIGLGGVLRFSCGRMLITLLAAYLHGFTPAKKLFFLLEKFR